MPTQVVLTVDTEPTVACAFLDPIRFLPMIDEPVAGIVGGRSEALGFIIESLTAHGLVATFFVETAQVRAFGPGPMGGYVDALCRAGQDVQLHLHPVWRSWSDGTIDPARRSTDMCADVPRDELAQLIGEGREQIRAWTGTAATGFRTGNFSSSRSVFQASADAGIRYSSHISLGNAPPREPELRLAGGVHRIEGVTELPVTNFVDTGLAGRGALRPLQINGVSLAEMTAALERLSAAGAPVAVIVMHPFDFLKRTDRRFSNLRANRLVQRRFRLLCRWLADRPRAFEVTTLARAAEGRPETPELLLRGDPVAATWRAARNYLNDRYF